MATEKVTKYLGKIAAYAILSELRDDKKATSSYLTSVSGKHCWENMSEQHKEHGIEKMAVNDPAESSFGGVTSQLRSFGRINLTSAGGVDQCKRNGIFGRGFNTMNEDAKTNNVRIGIFHTMPKEMKESLIEMSMENASMALKVDKQDIQIQHEEKRNKEELMRKHKIKQATKSQIES